MTNPLDQFTTEELIAEIIRRTKKFSMTCDDLKGSPTLEIVKLRWINTRYLVEQIGGINALAEKMGKGQSQTSQFAGSNPIKNIGHKVAREIEIACNLPVGWLDNYHDHIKYMNE